MEFIEASAKQNTNIQEAFARLAKEICEVNLPANEADLTPSFSLIGHNTVALHNDDHSSSCSC